MSPEPSPIQILHGGTDIYQNKMVHYISSRVLPCDTLWYFQFDVFTCHCQSSHTITKGRKDTNLISWFELSPFFGLAVQWWKEMGKGGLVKNDCRHSCLSHHPIEIWCAAKISQIVSPQ